MGGLQTTFSCSFSTGSALLYPFTRSFHLFIYKALSTTSQGGPKGSTPKGLNTKYNPKSIHTRDMYRQEPGGTTFITI